MWSYTINKETDTKNIKNIIMDAYCIESEVYIQAMIFLLDGKQRAFQRLPTQWDPIHTRPLAKLEYSTFKFLSRNTCRNSNLQQIGVLIFIGVILWFLGENLARRWMLLLSAPLGVIGFWELLISFSTPEFWTKELR